MVQKIERINMYELIKIVRFEAAHHLPHYDGLCRRPHGHSFEAHLHIEGEKLQTTGPCVDMLKDYKEIGDAVKPLLESKLDHHDLNETLPLENPTSERIAEWLYWELKKKLPELAAVTIMETCTAQCTYRPTERKENKCA